MSHLSPQRMNNPEHLAAPSSTSAAALGFGHPARQSRCWIQRVTDVLCTFQYFFLSLRSLGKTSLGDDLWRVCHFCNVGNKTPPTNWDVSTVGSFEHDTDHETICEPSWETADLLDGQLPKAVLGHDMWPPSSTTSQFFFSVSSKDICVREGCGLDVNLRSGLDGSGWSSMRLHHLRPKFIDNSWPPPSGHKKARSPWRVAP